MPLWLIPSPVVIQAPSLFFLGGVRTTRPTHNNENDDERRFGRLWTMKCILRTGGLNSLDVRLTVADEMFLQKVDICPNHSSAEVTCELLHRWSYFCSS
jgi:hypothetical protein